MANELTDAGEILALDLLAGGAQTITGPLKLALVTVIGTDAAAGTEVTGGSYARQSVTLAGGANPDTNTNAIAFTGMPACTVVGYDIYDSSATPKRIWWGSLTSTAFTAGNTATVAVGALSLSLN